MSANTLHSAESLRRGAARATSLAIGMLLAGCSSLSLFPSRPADPPVMPRAEPAPAPAPVARPVPTPAPAPVAPAVILPAPAPAPVIAAPTVARPRASTAGEPRAYRADAAQHLYQANRHRIYPGKLPPMLYAVGVLDVEVDSQGEVRGLNWQRAPRHAPEVMAEIERTVRAAAPYPAPSRMGRVVYTDVWLWDRSGRFQLDTLTEGQN